MMVGRESRCGGRPLWNCPLLYLLLFSRYLIPISMAESVLRVGRRAQLKPLVGEYEGILPGCAPPSFPPKTPTKETVCLPSSVCNTDLVPRPSCWKSCWE